MISFSDFAKHLRKAAESIPARMAVANAEIAESAAIEARHMIGHKQPGWADLSARTIDDKGKLGFSPPDFQPLLRTGEMRDSIKWVSTAFGGAIGSNNQKMVYHELGTSKMPPRPVLGLALLKTVPLMEHLYGEMAVTLIRPIRD